MPLRSRRLRARVTQAAQGRCEYCQTPQDLTLATFHLDHIMPRGEGGATEFENLCLSCPFCNEFKGAKSRARDPQTGRQVLLFNPRRDRWRRHFQWSEDGVQIIGLTARGAPQLRHCGSTIGSRRPPEDFGWPVVFIPLNESFLTVAGLEREHQLHREYCKSEARSSNDLYAAR
jgi:HNH endonuclease